MLVTRVEPCIRRGDDKLFSLFKWNKGLGDVKDSLTLTGQSVELFEHSGSRPTVNVSDYAR